MFNLKIRYKEPAGNVSPLMEISVRDTKTIFNAATEDFRFAAAVASFGMILRDSPHKGGSTLESVIDIAEKSRGSDTGGYRDRFLQLAKKTQALPE